MSRKYRAKRATAKWLIGAPEYVLCCFDHPNYADRYTVVFGGSMQEGDGTFGGAWLHALATSESGHTSGSVEFKAYELGLYRASNYQHQVKWSDLPLSVRLRARYWAEIPFERKASPEEIARIGDEEKALAA